jgi:hypothetical protein
MDESRTTPQPADAPAPDAPAPDAPAPAAAQEIADDALESVSGGLIPHVGILLPPIYPPPTWPTIPTLPIDGSMSPLL